MIYSDNEKTMIEFLADTELSLKESKKNLAKYKVFLKKIAMSKPEDIDAEIEKSLAIDIWIKNIIQASKLIGEYKQRKIDQQFFLDRVFEDNAK